MHDDESGHEALQVVSHFNRWWARRYGIKVWYLTKVGAEVFEGRLIRCTDGTLILALTHTLNKINWNGVRITVLANGLPEYQADGIPIIRWWFR